MPTATRATTLVTFVRAKDYLGTELNVRDEDVVTMADAASEFIENHTGRKFVTRQVVETHDGDGGQDLRLEWFPTTAVASITIARTFGGTPEAVSSSDYAVDLAEGRIRLNGDVLTRGFQNVVVTHSPGFGDQDAATLPEDIVLACLDLVKMRWDERRAHATAASTIAIGNTQYVLRADWPRHILDALEQWRVPVLA